jgi:hypothetical protein
MLSLKNRFPDKWKNYDGVIIKEMILWQPATLQPVAITITLARQTH